MTYKRISERFFEPVVDWSETAAMVTGGAGFIGSHVVDELARRGAPRIYVIDDLSRTRGSARNIKEHIDSGRVIFYNRDMSGRDGRMTAMAHLRDSMALFHLAARVTNIAENERNHYQMWLLNTELTTSVAQLVAACRPLVSVLVSTVCVYPHDVPIPTPESAGRVCDPEPTNHGYGVAKWTLEQAARYLADELGLAVVVPRFSNAFGLRDYYDKSSHVAPALIRRVIDGEDPLVVWGTGEQTRSLIDARDIAAALVDLAECPRAHDASPVNVGHAREVSVGALARMVAKLAGNPFVKITFDTTRPDGHKRRAVDIGRLVDLIGWAPARPTESTLRDMITEFREGKSWL